MRCNGFCKNTGVPRPGCCKYLHYRLSYARPDGKRCGPKKSRRYQGTGLRTSWDISGKNVVLVFSRPMTFEALIRGVFDRRLFWVSALPDLETPTPRGRIFFCVLYHDGQRLSGALHVRAISIGELEHVFDKNAVVRIRPALLERGKAGRIHINAMHSANFAEQRARFIDDHGIDMEPLPIPPRLLDVVGRFCGK